MLLIVGMGNLLRVLLISILKFSGSFWKLLSIFWGLNYHQNNHVVGPLLGFSPLILILEVNVVGPLLGFSPLILIWEVNVVGL
jgi:hypothetical protein